ncbi:phosphatase PAP2 family protein [Candidatus Cloacimonadota bacterium]
MTHNDKVVKIWISSKIQLICVITASILWLISILLWKQNLLDNNIILLHNPIYSNELAQSFFHFFSGYGLPLITITYIVNLFISKRNPEMQNVFEIYLLIIFSFALSGIAGDLLKEIINRARPAAALAGEIIRTSVSDTPSLPSGHSTKSIALVLPYIVFASNKPDFNKLIKLILMTIALLVCYSRLALQAHYLSDILAGIGTAFIFLPLSVTFTNSLYRRRNMYYSGLAKFVQKIGFILIFLTIIFCVM